MVSTTWLAKDGNSKYDDGRIIDSGILWGDAKDPEDVQRLLKRVKLEKEERAVKKEKDALKTGIRKSKGKGKAKGNPFSTFKRSDWARVCWKNTSYRERIKSIVHDVSRLLDGNVSIYIVDDRLQISHANVWFLAESR